MDDPGPGADRGPGADAGDRAPGANRGLILVDIDATIVLAHSPSMPLRPASAGLRCLPALDMTRKLARLEFDDVEARLLSPPGPAAEALARTLDLAVIALAAEQVGGAQCCLDMSLEYAKTRFQFGRPIGSFQAIKHKCAGMLLDVESARSAAYFAAWAAADGSAELPAVASLAKAYCSEAFSGRLARTSRSTAGLASPGSTTRTFTLSEQSLASFSSATPSTTESSWSSGSACDRRESHLPRISGAQTRLPTRR